MESRGNSRRPYNSPRRQEQARLTRRAILDAALSLFVGPQGLKGYFLDRGISRTLIDYCFCQHWGAVFRLLAEGGPSLAAQGPARYESKTRTLAQVSRFSSMNLRWRGSSR